ncbi:MAG: hypothetical protein PHV47_00715 [Candidatus Pacebacteria bacterium]|nr:hypothetical protein [Candidatus Paceibacterota bacterium]
MNTFFILELILEIVAVIIFFLLLEYVYVFIRLRTRRKVMDELAFKYGLKNNSKMPTIIQWILRNKIDVNTILGMINNHQVKIIDITRQGLTGMWLRSTLVQIDEGIVKGHRLGSFIGGTFFHSTKTLDDIIKKETGIL